MLFWKFFPIIFIAWWILVLFILSKRGWQEFSERYNAFGNFSGTRAGIVSTRIKKIQYNGSIVLRYDSQGIYLLPLLIFRLFHKPIFIPWSEVKAVRKRKMSFWRIYELIVGADLDFVLILSHNVFRQIEQYVSLYKINNI
jgi:hypothetical protein